jgi:hypothetical protein
MNEKIQREYLSQIDREEIFQPKYRIKLKNTIVYTQEFDSMDRKLVAIYYPHKEADVCHIAAVCTSTVLKTRQ